MTGGLPFTPNEQALAAAKETSLYGLIQDRTSRFADTYRKAAEATGVPATMIAAIHFNESHQSQGTGPESGFGLDPDGRVGRADGQIHLRVTAKVPRRQREAEAIAVAVRQT